MQPKLKALHFPLAGMVRRKGFQQQGPYATEDVQNVIPDDPLLERERGGTRPATNRKYSTQLGAPSTVRLLSSVQYVSSGVTTERAVASANGVLYFSENGTSWTSVTSGVTLSSDRMLRAADILQKLYIASDDNANDNICVYDPSANTLATITASAGTAPTKCFDLVAHGTRLYAAVDQDNPHRWYASKIADPTDWDYTAAGSDRAVNGTNIDRGQLSEPIRGLCSHGADCLIIFCSTSIWVLRGDPGGSGQIDNLSQHVGLVDRGAWCRDPDGWLWWLDRDGVYCMPPGCGSNPISVSRERLPQELRNVDRSTTTVNMGYDYFHRGIQIAVSKNSADDGTGHFWLDTKTTLFGDQSSAQASFWPLAYQTDHEPFCLYELKDSTDAYSVLLQGGRDGYVRRWKYDQEQDDGSNEIVSHLYLGPIMMGGGGFAEGMLQQLSVVTAVDSGDVKWEVFVGDSAQQAYNKTDAQAEGFWRGEGAHSLSAPRVRGAAMYVKLSNGQTDKRWALESLEAVLLPQGRRRV